MTDLRIARVFMTTTAVLSAISNQACTEAARSKIAAKFPTPGLIAMAVGNSTQAQPIASKPADFSDVAFYNLKVQDILMGSAVVAKRQESATTEYFGEFKIGHRLGYAPLVTSIRMSGWGSGDKIKQIKQFVTIQNLDSIVFESEAAWTEGPQGSLELVSGDPTLYLGQFGLSPEKPRIRVESEPASTVQLLPLFNPQPNANSRAAQIFNPLAGAFFSSSEMTLSPGQDGFADSIRIPWFSGLTLDFSRDSEKEIEQLPSRMSQSMLELAWFSAPSTIQDDLRQLQRIALNGTQFARSAEKTVRKEFPQLPYLFHRKLFNFNKLCDRVTFEMSLAQSRRLSAEQALTQIGWLVRNTLAEDHRELPRSLVNSPELEILADDSKKWQWARIISNILLQTNDELRQVLEIEESQKVNVSVRMRSRQLARGSVVKGMLRSGALLVQHEVQNAGNLAVKPSSLDHLPLNILQPVKVALNQSARESTALKASSQQTVSAPFEFINGQSFAKGEFQTFSTLCEAFRGRIGLDLGQSRNELFSSNIVRGVWDESTRVQLIRQFARRASANPACRSIVLRAPGGLTTAARSELESFRKDILQTEMEFQISVGSNRTLRLVPGTYELVISSLVNGSILGKREIIIPQGHQSLVLNLQL